MNRSRLTVIAALVAVLALAGGVIAFTMGGDDDTSGRQRNAALDSKLDTSFGVNGLSLVSRSKDAISIVDSVTLSDGTTYMLGNAIVNGISHAFVRSTKNGVDMKENWVVNRDDYTLGVYGALTSTTGRALAADSKGNLFVLAGATTALDNDRYEFFQQLKPDLSYHSNCPTICGLYARSWIGFQDLAVSTNGERLMMVSPQQIYSLKITVGNASGGVWAGILGGSLSGGCSSINSGTHVVANETNFYIVNASTSPKTVTRATFDISPRVVECTDKLPLLTVSDMALDGDGSLYVYGKSTETTVGFWRLQPGAMSSGSGRGSLSPRMPDVATTNVFPGGVTVSSGTVHMAAAVNSLNGPKTIIEYVVRNASSNISTALDSASSDFVASTPPLLTRHSKTLTLISPTLNAATPAAVMARFNATEPLVGAPEWPSTNQTMNLKYNSNQGIALAQPSPTGNLSIDKGSLPPGMRISLSRFLAGTPQAVGTFKATLKSTNSGGSSTAEVTFNVEAVAPTEGMITGWRQVDGNVIIKYAPGTYGSDTDKVTALATDPTGTTIIAECVENECVYPEGQLDEGVAHEVRVSHKNDIAEALSMNSLTVTPLGMAQKVTDVEVGPGLLKALVSFTPPANTADLTVTRFDVAIRDKATDGGVSATSCDASPCEIDVPAPDSKRKYIAEVTAVYNDAYSTSPVRSSEFSVKTPPPAPVELAFNSALKYVVAARQEFVIPVIAQGDGDVKIDVQTFDHNVEFLLNPARLAGALNPGIYEFPVTATDSKGTVESTVTIEVTPGMLPIPDGWFNFNAYDGKLSMFPEFDWLVADAMSHLAWTARFNGTEVSGRCQPNRLCPLPEIPFETEVDFRFQAVSDIEEPSEWVEMTLYTPEKEEPVAIDSTTFRRIPVGDDIGVVEFAVRTSIPRKFVFDLQAPATVQVDAESGCNLDWPTRVYTFREEALDYCPLDPYVRLLSADAVIAEDDDTGSTDLYDPSLTEEEKEFAEPLSTINYLGSRMSTPVDPGAFTLEVAQFQDFFMGNNSRQVRSEEIDIYLVIITTPAEADRLAALSLEAQPTTVVPQGPIDVMAAAGDITMVPPTMSPQNGTSATAPKVNSKANASGATITDISVTAGNRALTLTPNVITASPKAPQVTITLTPGNKSCTTTAGKACTIKGLSPWLTYSASAIVPGDATGANATGLRPALQLKAGGKVSVSSLGLAAAARTVKAAVAKNSLRASGSCTLNPAQTVLTVGKTGSCSVTVRTTKTVQKKAVAGPSLSLRAVIVK